MSTSNGKALTRFDELKPGGEIVLLLYREPFPLYDVLKRNGYRYRTETQPDGTFEIHITQAG